MSIQDIKKLQNEIMRASMGEDSPAYWLHMKRQGLCPATQGEHVFDFGDDDHHIFEACIYCGEMQRNEKEA